MSRRFLKSAASRTNRQHEFLREGSPVHDGHGIADITGKTKGNVVGRLAFGVRCAVVPAVMMAVVVFANGAVTAAENGVPNDDAGSKVTKNQDSTHQSAITKAIVQKDAAERIGNQAGSSHEFATLNGSAQSPESVNTAQTLAAQNVYVGQDAARFGAEGEAGQHVTAARD